MPLEQDLHGALVALCNRLDQHFVRWIGAGPNGIGPPDFRQPAGGLHVHLPLLRTPAGVIRHGRFSSLARKKFIRRAPLRKSARRTGAATAETLISWKKPYG